jgi:N-acetylglucosamine kinase-like BadF-type ATPase
MEDNMSHILAIDQGGTKTDIVIADMTGNIRGFANDRDLIASGAIDHYPTYYKKDRRVVRIVRIRHAVEKALAEAGLKLSDIQSISASCNGADWEYEYDLWQKDLHDALGTEKISIYNDCIGALRGGTETKGRDCAIICLGTGANCAVKNREGDEYIYAYYLKSSHQGSGAIGWFIFDAVYDAESGFGPQTALTQLLLEKTGYKSTDELLMHITAGRHKTETQWEPLYQEYSSLLFQAIKMGDKVAKDYLDWLCKDLARYVIVASQKLNMQDREITVVLSGGVAKNGALMSELLEMELKKQLHKVKCVNARLEPVAGALLLEYDRLFTDEIPQDVMHRFEQSCTERDLFRKFTME